MLLARRNNDSDWLSNFFDDTLFNTEVMSRMNATAPAINIKETDKNYIMEVAAPGLKKEWYDTLKVMGNSLGRFIYSLDAYDDLLEDKKKGRYNALRTYENNKDFDIFIENVLKSHMAQFAAGFESLPIIENVDLLRKNNR